MICKITIHDEINATISGLKEKHLLELIEKTKLRVKGSQHSALFKIGAWDGKESFIKEDGATFVYMLDKVLDRIEGFGYSIDLQDRRKDISNLPELIDAELFENHGINLRYYQVEAVNEAIEQQKGILNVATSGGKTLITAAIAKAFQPYRTLVIVPSENLVDQTYNELLSVGMESGRIYAKTPPKKRPVEWAKETVIATWQTLNHARSELKKFDVFLFDECHNVGDVMFSVMANDMAHAHVRIGLTGTPPNDKHKFEKLACHLGGGVLYTIEPKQLMDEGHISNVNITMVPIEHNIDLPDESWDVEFDYLLTNERRMEEIRAHIQSLDSQNTLILTHPKFGKKLAEKMGLDFIDKDVTPQVRTKFFEKFYEKSDYQLVATWGTVGTGISIKDIFRLIMIDVGKDHVKIIQGIGRACRLDTKGINSVEIIDLYSRLFYSERHKKERIREYKKKQYPFVELPPLVVA